MMNRLFPILAFVFPLLFAGAGPTRSQALELVAPGRVEGGWFGVALVAAPDLIVPGRTDLVVGANWENAPGAEAPLRAGRVHVFNGQSQALSFTLVSPNAETNGAFGAALSAIGDLNNDGRGDLIIGAYRESPRSGPQEAGRVYAFNGSLRIPLYALTSPHSRERGHFGFSVSAVADTNGDGIDDVLVGAVGENLPGQPQGAGLVHVFDGARGILIRTLSSPNPQLLGGFGHAVAGLPDVTGDGFGDILVGAVGETAGGRVFAGRAYLFNGATGALVATLQSPSPQDNGGFGVSLSVIGDVTNDQTPDFIIGAWGESESPETPRSGRAYVYNSLSRNLARTLRPPTPQTNGRFGVAVAGAPDLTDDRFAEILVGAAQEASEEGLPEAGRVYVFDGLRSWALRIIDSPEALPNGRFGLALLGMDAPEGSEWPAQAVVGAPQENAPGEPDFAGRAWIVPLEAPPVLSGRVTSQHGVAMANVQIVTTPTLRALATDANGEYSFYVPDRWSGELTAWLPNHVPVVPTTRTVTNVRADQPGLDFTITTPTTVVIQGIAQYADRTPCRGAWVLSSDGLHNAQTNASGLFTLTVPYGWSGEIAIALQGHVFNPPRREITRIVMDSQDPRFNTFLATRLQNVMSGTVRDPNGRPIAGVTVRASGLSASAVTDAEGRYSLAGPFEYEGVLTATKTQYHIEPQDGLPVSLTGDMTGLDFVAHPYPAIQGRIVQPDGQPLADIPLRSTDQTTATITGDDGRFRYTVPYGWSGWIRPDHGGIRFYPAQVDLDALTTDTAELVFVGRAYPTISGRVLAPDGSPISGETIVTSDAGLEATTNGAGEYHLAVPYGWTGWLRPAGDHGTTHFTPPVRRYAQLTTSQSLRQNFWGDPAPGEMLVDLSAMLPPVRNQTDQGVARWAPIDYSQQMGYGPAWAMGYYLKTLQETRNRQRNIEDVWTSPALQYSPWFLAANGGFGSLYPTASLLVGHGTTAYSQFDTPTTTTTQTHLDQARENRSLATFPLFHRVPTWLPGRDRISVTGHLDNYTTGTSISLSNGNPFALGIPVFESFAEYESGVYDVVDRADEKLLGFHAVCVVGHDREQDAYKIVNSWGQDWGMGGFGWVSEAFIRRFAIEAWRLHDPSGFEPLDAAEVVTTGTALVRTADYRIRYRTRGAGQMRVNADGIDITGGMEQDVLRIAHRYPGRRGFGEHIPLVRTDNALSVFYTEGTIGRLETAGAIGRLTARRAHVGHVVTPGVRRIAMTDRPDATWPQLAVRVRQPDFVLPNHADFFLQIDRQPGPRPLPCQILLRGVRLGGLVAPESVVQLKVMSGRNVHAQGPVFVSDGAIARLSPQGVQAREFAAIQAVGAAIDTPLLANTHLGRGPLTLRARGQVFTWRVADQRYCYAFPGDVTADTIRLWNPEARVVLRGGDFNARRLLTAGHISRFLVQGRPWRDEQLQRAWLGGYIGGFPHTGRHPLTADEIDGLPHIAAGLVLVNQSAIQAVHGAFGVRAVFHAGATLDAATGALTPTFQGRLGLAQTLPPARWRQIPFDLYLARGPYIHGVANVRAGSNVPLRGDRSAVAEGRFTIRHSAP